MKFSRSLLVLGLILVLPTLSTNPSHSQSLKDQLYQDQEKEKIRKQNCVRILEYGQYQVPWGRFLKRFYVDPNNNVHSAFVPDPNDNDYDCKPFIGKIGKSTIETSKCYFHGTTKVQYKYVTEYLVEGNNLTEYKQTIFVRNCQSFNPEIVKGSIKTKVFKKFR